MLQAGEDIKTAGLPGHGLRHQTTRQPRQGNTVTAEATSSGSRRSPSRSTEQTDHVWGADKRNHKPYHKPDETQ